MLEPGFQNSIIFAEIQWILLGPNLQFAPVCTEFTKKSAKFNLKIRIRIQILDVRGIFKAGWDRVES
jgi:hypothetical protein